MNPVVLIADGNSDRGERLAQACAALGISAGLACQGPEALETALGEIPQVMVAQLDLPLISGLTLAAILRANPKTEGVRFLFLADESASASRPGVGDEVITLPADPNDIARRVNSFFAKPPPPAPAPASGPRSQIEGQLAQLSLADLLQLLQGNRRTGSVELEQKGALKAVERGQVYVRDGEVIQALVGRVEGEKALFRLLGWRSGSFAFVPTVMPVRPTIQRPTRALLMEGMRQLDEWNRVAGSLPPADGTVTLQVASSELPNVVQPLTQEVLLLLEMYSLVQDVVDHCSFPDYQVLRTLHSLISQGIVQHRRGTGEARAGAGEGESLASPEQIARLQRWLEAGQPRGAAVRGLKLLVIPAEPAALHEFSRLLAMLPGVRLESPSAEGGFDELASLGQVALGRDLAIELLHVPVGESFAPLWPVAAHGALGTFFLLSGPVSKSVAAVQRAAEFFRSLPRARTFHVALLRKGERTSPDELREHLSLLDEASLFLVPAESPKSAAALLTNLFGRVLL